MHDIIKIAVLVFFPGFIYQATGLPLKHQADGRKGFGISVQMKPYKNCKVFLAHYFGNDLLKNSEAMLNNNGEAVFTGDSALHPGIYVVYEASNKDGVDFLVDSNQYFSLKAEFNGGAQVVQFQNSSENALLNTYKKYMAYREAEIIDYRQRLAASANLDDSAVFIKQLKVIDDSIQKFRQLLIGNNPSSFLSSLLKAMNEPAVPEQLRNPKNSQDSANARYFKRIHFWDGVNFWDSRLLYTPFFSAKLDKYFTEIVDRSADSVIQQIDWMMSTAVANEEMTHVILEKLFWGTLYHRFKWEDAVFIHLFEKYLGDKTYSWLLPADKKSLSEYAYLLMANNKGTKAYEISLPGIDGKKKSLQQEKAKYTLLCFWDVTCSHCRETLPLLDSLYRTTGKNKGLKIFAVSVESDGNRDNWLSYIQTYHLEDWNNVYNSVADEKEQMDKGQKSVQQLYNVWYFPSFYLLDSEKHFMAKKLKYPQIAELIQSVLTKD